MARNEQFNQNQNRPPLTPAQKRMRDEKRRKRKRKKQIRAFFTLILIVLIFAAVIFGVVKGVSFLKGDSESIQSSENIQSSDSAQSSDNTQSTDSTGSQTSETTDSTNSDSTQSSDSTAQTAKPEQSWSTILVNVNNPMPSDYTVETRTVAGTERLFDVRAADSLEQMLNDAKAAGYNMYLVSTYRTVEYQQGLYDRKVQEYINSGYDEETAKAEAAKWVAIPGTSEHSLGLAADIVSSTWYNTNTDLTEDFEKTEHFDWLYENCANYGFILRFPKGRESITGISYEPWHYRYVGVEAAKYIMENDITLEEFCAG